MKESPNGYVYFVRDPEHGSVKIGWSGNVLDRLEKGSTFNPAELILLGTVPGTRRDERRIHDQFASLHVRREWFRETPELLNTIRELIRIKGTLRTVAEECKRRNHCRFGLRNVVVGIVNDGDGRYYVWHSEWRINDELWLTVDRKPRGETRVFELLTLGELLERTAFDDDGRIEVPASQCYLLSEWPITCRCWCDSERTQP